MTRSIAFKLSALLTLSALVPMALAFVIATRVMAESSADVSSEASAVAHAAMRDTLEREATGLVTALTEQAKSPLVIHDFAALWNLVRTMSKSPNVKAVRIVDQRGFVVADGTTAPISRMISAERYLALPDGSRVDKGELSVRRPVVLDDKTIGQVVVSFSLGAEAAAEARLTDAISSSESRAKQKLVWSSVAAAGVLGVFFMVLALGLGKRVVRPIVALRDGTRKVAAGDWSVRIDVAANDEIGELTSGFNTMAQELDHARVALQEQARISREMEIAERIQTSLVPRAPQHPEFDFAGRMDPADDVGGDVYDVLAADDRPLWLTIGDVSNHGLAAGLVMLMAQSAFTTAWARAGARSPAEAFVQVNTTLYSSIRERMGDNKYITALIVTYRGGGEFSYAGGHLWPLVFRHKTGEVEQLRVEGPWLGILRAMSLPPELHFSLEPGDVLCLYTDGVIEAMDGSGEQYDLGRLKKALEQAAKAPDLTAGVDGMFADFARHSEQRADDRTVLLVRRRAQPAQADGAPAS